MIHTPDFVFNIIQFEIILFIILFCNEINKLKKLIESKTEDEK